VAADIMQVQAAGANPAGLQAAAKHFEQVSINSVMCRLSDVAENACRHHRARWCAIVPSCVLAPLPQLKQGEIHASTEVAAELAAPSSPMEVQHFGYALLQHLVRSPNRAMPPYSLAPWLSLVTACKAYSVRNDTTGRDALGGVQRTGACPTRVAGIRHAYSR
jgi:hypothetical protein